MTPAQTQQGHNQECDTYINEGSLPAESDGDQGYAEYKESDGSVAHFGSSDLVINFRRFSNVKVGVND
jgi:hypothetical protein